MVLKPRKLTAKQQRFVDEYLVDLNASAAAKRAGYSPKTADQLGYQLLQIPLVAAAISAGRQIQTTRAQIDAQWLMDRLATEVDADIADILNDDGSLKPVKEWPKVWRQGLVSGVEIEQLFEGRGEERVHVGNLAKVKLSERIRRLELIGRHKAVGAFVEKHEHSGPDGKPIEVTDVTETELARRIAFALAQGIKQTVQ